MKTNYVLIDYENVKPESIELLDQEWIRVYLFVGKNQARIPLGLAKTMQCLGERAHYVTMSGVGPNALDFHIAYYIGRLSATDPQAYFHIISKDKGFDPLVEHLKSEHIFADRIADIEAMPAMAQAKIAAKTTPERVAFVREKLLQPGSQRPRTRKTLTNHVATLFGKLLSESDLTTVVEGLFAADIVRENGKRLVYSADEG